MCWNQKQWNLEIFPCVFQQWGQYHYLFERVGCTRLLVLLVRNLGRVQSTALFWADTDVVIFHCRQPMSVFCNTQTTVERQYFNVIKKCITWNSLRTWVTKIVKNQGLVQPSANGPKLSECYVIGLFIGTISEWSEYCALLHAVRGLHVTRNSKENLH